MRAGIYTRLSKDRPDETSRERQEEDCRALCSAKGLDVAEVWTDLLSGYRRSVRRPGYEAALAALRAGEIDRLVIWKLDRLTRQGVREVARLLEALEVGGGTLLSVQDSIDTSTAMGEGVLALLASVAKQESENISVRIRSAKALAAREGRPSGGRRPFGYLPGGMVADPEEAGLVEEAARRVCGGESVYSVAQDWRRRGVRTPLGNPWSTSSLRGMLAGPHIRGRTAGGVDAVWPALLAPGVGEVLDLRLRAKRKGKPVTRNLLTGLLACGRCGSRMTSAREGRSKQRVYVCPGDGCRMQVLAEPLDRLAGRAVRAWVSAQDLSVAEDPDRWAGAAVALEALRARLVDLEEAYYVRQEMDTARFRQLKDGLDRRIDEAEAGLERETGVRLVDVDSGWEVWSLEQRRQLVSAFFPRIVIGPARQWRVVEGRASLEDRDGTSWRWEDGPDGEELRPVAGSVPDARFLRL